MGPWKMLTGGQLGNKDSWLGLLGRAAFFEGLADFPVLYLDQDMAGARLLQLPPVQLRLRLCLPAVATAAVFMTRMCGYAVFRFPPLQSSIAVRKLPVLSQ